MIILLSGLKYVEQGCRFLFRVMERLREFGIKFSAILTLQVVFGIRLSIFGHLKDDAVGIWNAVSKKAGQIWNSVERHTVEPVKRAWKTAVDIFNNLKRDMGNILDGISSKWHSMWNKMAKFFSGIWKGIKTSAKDSIMVL